MRNLNWDEEDGLKRSEANGHEASSKGQKVTFTPSRLGLAYENSGECHYSSRGNEGGVDILVLNGKQK